MNECMSVPHSYVSWLTNAWVMAHMNECMSVSHSDVPWLTNAWVMAHTNECMSVVLWLHWWVMAHLNECMSVLHSYVPWPTNVITGLLAYTHSYVPCLTQCVSHGTYEWAIDSTYQWFIHVWHDSLICGIHISVCEWYVYACYDMIHSYSQLQIGWHRILRLFLIFFNLVPGVPEFSWDLSVVLFITWY